MDQPRIFDVGNASRQSFGILMNQIDAFFMHRSIIQYYRVPLTLNRDGWLLISLRLGDAFIDLAINAKDGYLSAFREGGGAGAAQQEPPWYHFSDCSTVGLGGGAKRKLSLESNYAALVRGNWNAIVAGKVALMDSFHKILGFLFAHRQDNAIPACGVNVTDEEAKALARTIAMLCEPSRLRSPREFVASCMDSGVNKKFSSKVMGKIKNWSRISHFALHCLGLAVKNSDILFDEEELKIVKHLFIYSLEETVGPHGELLLILCSDHTKKKLDVVRS